MKTQDHSALPLILEIKANSLDDGPGIRSVVFFKGCPLSCAWCHNPESKISTPEISHDQNACVGCNTCMDICQKKAISSENQFFIDRNICDLCFECVDVCPSNALEQVGIKMQILQIVDKILKYKPFFETSGGGVTLSGGEPTLNMQFLSKLLITIKAKGIHTLIETCGLFNFDRFKSLIYPYTDIIYFDLKIWKTSDHKRFCGIGNELILNNFKALQALCLNSGVTLVPRIPLIPGITDTNENITKISKFLKSLYVEKAVLIPYHSFWKEKIKKLGIENSDLETKDMPAWVEPDQINACKDIMQDAGIKIREH
ncbi:MAG: glycyl-radical enzyme activating protein [Desulfobacula sp.]|jgi:pyruvate formate lyase activating enzyme|uniref:glycyl-radical enzyme activating protein n=1 Tax=Desulfobacula sp. TaxID=2593537 RepID=UPI001D1A7830|nr:glycyl-radical enzyme activating protein [Desulfobacula sp.]MBT3807562.1 glycyl-radical enzyme activating protein [Desulfobacula sp.]MBT4027543.1 glycyl-radical enzyme activating protein [Desulfobacula sp.]MBT6338491.1 glycyl-radical enzyme activating protein [Desulfobacula sp.]